MRTNHTQTHTIINKWSTAKKEGKLRSQPPNHWQTRNHCVRLCLSICPLPLPPHLSSLVCLRINPTRNRLPQMPFPHATSLRLQRKYSSPYRIRESAAFSHFHFGSFKALLAYFRRHYYYLLLYSNACAGVASLRLHSFGDKDALMCCCSHFKCKTATNATAMKIDKTRW